MKHTANWTQRKLDETRPIIEEALSRLEPAIRELSRQVGITHEKDYEAAMKVVRSELRLAVWEAAGITVPPDERTTETAEVG